MYESFKNKRILVTGACGTIGRQLVRQFVENAEMESILCIDNNESELMFMEETFADRGPAEFFLGDVRDKDNLIGHTKKIDIVYHTAALKHVYLCERSPLEAIQTNILGIQNVISAAIDNEVERIVFTSSDKAVNPTNVMGTSKLMGERLMSAASTDKNEHSTVFISTRFGNVLGSRGSVIPLFLDHIRRGGPVMLTDPEMTRFIMSLDEAVRLVVESTFVGKSGDVMITKMPTIRIKDLAEVMIRECAPQFGHRPDDIKIKIVGTKPGEKMYEELMNEEEMRRAFELKDYFVVQPAVAKKDETPDYAGLVSTSIATPYNSANEKPLSQKELSLFLEKNNVLREALIINDQVRADHALTSSED